MHRSHLILPALVAGALSLAGCSGPAGGDAHADHGADPPAEGAREIAVAASSFAFDPDPIELTAGEEVAIVLTATDIAHDLVIDDADFHLHADPAETATGGLRIDEAGTYTAYCSIEGHREAGMEAAVTVSP